MKTKILALFGLVSFFLTMLASPAALAVGSGATEVRNLYGPSPVLTWQYSQLIASTSKGVSGVQVNNTGPHPVLLAFGAPGSEVAQIIVGNLSDTGFLPVAGGYATSISVVSLDGPNETGELDLNVFYN